MFQPQRYPGRERIFLLLFFFLPSRHLIYSVTLMLINKA